MNLRYSFFVLLRATPDWLRLSREERGGFFARDFASILARHPAVKLRYFDAEAYSARCSDIAIFETTDPREYYFVMERIRDSKFATVPYFEIVDIIPAIEEGFRVFEQSTVDEAAPGSGGPS